MTGKAILLNKQIWLAVGMVTFIGAVVATGTGAFFSDTAQVTGNTFAAGTLDLQLTGNQGGGSPADTLSNQWNFTNMAPGGTPESSSVWLRNVGSVDGATLGVSATFSNNASTPSQVATAKQLRITEMTLDGNNLLVGGAGHSFGDYQAPTNCDIEVNFGNNDFTRISQAVDAAAAGQVICVGAGNYSTTWETNGGGTGFPIRIDANNVTVASVTGPAATTVGGGFIIDNPDVILTGFTINGESTLHSETFGVYVNGAASDATISFNDLQGSDTADSRGVVTEGGSSNAIVTNVRANNWATGIFFNPSTDMTATKNTLENNNVGISNDKPNGNTVTLNNIINNTLEGAGVLLATSGNTLTFEMNNIFGNGVDVVQYGSEAVVAGNNWWGDFNPSDQTNGLVTTTNFAGGPFAGRVGGADANSNGYADLDDLRLTSITGITPGLDSYTGSNDQEFVLAVQLDGPTTGNNFQGASLVGYEVEFSLNQI